MKSTMILALSLFASVVVGNPMAANPFDGMTIVTMSYVGPITPGDEDMTLNGTAQEIHA
ncbi:hypothetical protein ABVK25_005821 [Lepraria finkii]|uniref:Uncharacterized protein n=1 Tax=Lepraria finkii TaxID=1340010 RepID=A0ABR4B7Q2_9LECA